MRSGFRACLVPVLLVCLVPSCATFRSVSALSEVQFSLDYVHRVELAGVNLDRITSYQDLGTLDVLLIAGAASQGTLPLSLTLEMSARNPQDNPTARILAMDWVLFLEGRETVRGVLDREIVIPSGQVTGFALGASLDLIEFFDRSSRDLVDLVLGLVSDTGQPIGIHLEIVPTVDTPLGPVRFPRPITLGRP